MSPALAAVFGLLWGSFLNVCIYRTPRNIGLVMPRSFCPRCGARIRALDNIPVLSFILLGSRCRSCREPISWRYPIVEILTAIVFALVVLRQGVSPIALKWLLFESLMIVLFFTDLEERMLPDEYTLGGGVLAFVFCFVVPLPGLTGLLFGSDLSARSQSFLNAAAGALLLALPIYGVSEIYAWIRKQDGMGLGDIKLLGMMGAMLGVESGAKALLLGCCAGSLLGLALLVRQGGKAWRYELPFGSFLCASGALLPLVGWERQQF